jgi:integrase
MKHTKKFPFTNRAIQALPAHAQDSPSKSAEYSDNQVPGLRLTVGKSGIKRFGMRYTLLTGRTRYAPLGQFSQAFGVAEARAAAVEMRAIIDRGGDPLEERDRTKAMPTFGEFVREQYLPFCTQAGKRSSHDDESKFRLHLEPKFGRLRLAEITLRDIQLHHAATRESHSAATANRHLALLSALFRKAVEWGILDKNPATGVKQFKEVIQQTSYLDANQLAQFFAALDADENATAAAALKLLALAGVRREEALQAEWQHIDLDTGMWWLPRTKSGRGRYVTLNAAVVELLAAQPSRGESPWVFPGREGDKPINNVRKCMERALQAAGLPHVRIHDLRHGYASLAVAAGATLYEVQHLLGHASPQVTQRYAHMAESGLRRASQAVADVVGKALQAAQAKPEEVAVEAEQPA